MPSGLHQIRKLKIFGAILALSFLTVPILLSTLFLLTHPVSALDPTHTTDGSPITHGLDLELNVAPTLQVVIPTSTVSLTLTPNPDPSIPVFASENLVVSVATNNPTGYSLMLKADSTNLTNTVADREGNYSILPTLVDQVGGYTEESFTTNTWGYRNTNTLLNNIVTNNTTGNYNAFTPSSEILSSKLPTNLDQTSLDFAAKVDITQPAGTYELALDFTAVTNMVPGVVTITFDPNTGTGQMPVQQIESGTSQNLNPNTFTKEHYIFTGWNTKPDGTGTHYDNEQSYETVLDVANKSVTLYAQWELDVIDLGIMQEIAPDILSTLSEDAIYAATDSRDNTRYLLGKLKDGNLWMIQNLRLGEKADTYNLTAADSDTNGDFTLNGKSSDGIFTYGTNNGFNYTNDSSQFYCTEDYGCYYNWYAATVGSGTSATTSGNVEYSLCPKGWTLPTGGAGGQFEALAAAYNNSAIEMLVTPTTLTENTNGDKPGLTLGGAYSGSGATSVGTYGSYWSRTALSGQYGYLLGLNATAINPANSANKYNGRLSRCVLNTQTISDITYMQDVTPTIVANTSEGATATLIDKRDNTTYAVAKLPEGQLWMIQNLKLGSKADNYVLTTADSDVTTNFIFNGRDEDEVFPYGTNNGANNTYDANVYYCTEDYGCYYNWYIATAGTGTSALSTQDVNVGQSICPKGWTLPTRANFSSLIEIYNNNANMSMIVNPDTLTENLNNEVPGFLMGGSYNRYGAYEIGGQSLYWSKTNYHNRSAYRLAITRSSINASYNDMGKYVGLAVRCLAK